MRWHIIPLLVITMYVYYHELREKNYNVVLGGVALWGMDLFNEIWNSIVFFATGYAPVWGTPKGDTALQLLIGYNIEISFMFAITGVMTCMALPKDPRKKIFGINNRILLVILFTITGVAVEMFLNRSGVLSWDYPWWSFKAPWLILLIGYAPFFTIAFIVHDMKSRKRQFLTLGVLYGVDIAALVVLGIIGWL
jgi:hypothetical protein